MAPSPIFIVGTGRSGTTLLRLMLCAHPRIYIAHEPSFYVFEAFYPRKAPRRRFLAYYFRTPWFRWLGVDPARVLAALPDPLPPERMGEAYDAIMREKAAQYGRVRYGEKTPSHASHLGRIFADFPGARVIHVIRDPRDVAQSLSRMPWASANPWTNARLCAQQWREAARFRDRLLEVRLEDLLASPEATMRRVLDYVGEPWDAAVLDHAANVPDADDMPPLPWLRQAARPLAPAARPLSLRPAEIRAIERVSRPVMTAVGYEPVTLPEEPGALAVRWAALCGFGGWIHYVGAYFRLGLWLRDPSHFDGDKYALLWRRINRRAWANYPGLELPVAPALPSARAVTAVPRGAPAATSILD